jgi:hypothetical protein
LLIAVLMTMVWAVRKLVRVLGGVMYYLQKAFGGTPEAVDAEYYGPGTGRTPETAELRRFKSSSGQEKWIVVKRGQEVAVFKLGCDTQAIRSSGLYVPVEGDSLRGTSRLVSELRGCDRVHLCRNETCPEEGQHFQTYGLAKKYDPEKFELARRKGSRANSVEVGLGGHSGCQNQTGRLWIGVRVGNGGVHGPSYLLGNGDR